MAHEFLLLGNALDLFLQLIMVGQCAIGMMLIMISIIILGIGLKQEEVSPFIILLQIMVALHGC